MNAQTPRPPNTLELDPSGIPVVEMGTSGSSSWEPDLYDLPERPADDVWAVRECRHPHHIWERSRVNPAHWFNADTGTMRTWRTLVAEKAPLKRHDFDGQVWLVRADGEQIAVALYTNESAAIAAAGPDRRVHPWHVYSRPA